jgi:hypothetical protein
MPLPKTRFTFKIVTMRGYNTKGRAQRIDCYGIVTYVDGKDGDEVGIYTTSKDRAKVVCEALEEYAEKYDLGPGWFLLHFITKD